MEVKVRQPERMIASRNSPGRMLESPYSLFLDVGVAVLLYLRLVFGAAAVAGLTILSSDGSAGAAGSGTTTLLSVATNGTQSDEPSFEPFISDNGQVVAFESLAANLTSVNGPYADVFVRDTATGQTSIVSVASDGTPGNNTSGGRVAVSSDGRFVAFRSKASNLVPGDTNVCGSVPANCPDIFLRDRVAGTTERVNVGPEDLQANETTYGGPAISSDGRFVAFSSVASNLVADDTNNFCQADGSGPYNYSCADIFVKDRMTQETTRVSVSVDGSQANGGSFAPSMSVDGRYVAFWSDASNLVPDDTNSCGLVNCADIFVRDRISHTTERISVGTAGDQGNNLTQGPLSISADGRFVAFWSFASNLVPDDTNNAPDVFVHDRQTGATERVSVNSQGGQSSGPGGFALPVPRISSTGRFITFMSAASDLVAGDANNVCDTSGHGYFDDNCPDIFVHDRLTGRTELVSVNSAGEQSNGISQDASISGDGRRIAFDSLGSNLVAGDTNSCQLYPSSPPQSCIDVFLHEWPDEDGDGQWGPFDNCPTVANPGQTDTDGDLAGDDCDAPGSGNADCDDKIDSVDALKLLRHAVALTVEQSEPCADIGVAIGSGQMQGDVNCNGAVNSVDALLVLRYVAALPVALPPGCPALGP